MRLSDLILKDEYISSNADMETEIERITVNPGDTDDGSLFVILKEPKILYSFKEKPRAVLIERGLTPPPDIPYITVENIRREMSIVYSRFQRVDYSKFIMIGVTGTNGKTSTAAFIKKILTENGYKVGMIGTGHIVSGETELKDSKYSMTTPDPWDLYPALRKMADDGCTAVVMEVSSHALALEKVAPISFDYGIFTNLSEEHLDFHKNTDEYFAAKCKLMEISKTAVINIDDYYGRLLVSRISKRPLTAGILWRGDVYLTDVNNRGFDGLSYIYHGTNFSFRMNLGCSGTFNLYNTMLAAAVCIDIGIAPCKVKAALSDNFHVEGRYEIIKRKVTVIIDYAHTEAAFSNILSNLNSEKRGNQRITAVFGCGGNRDTGKRPKMAKIAEKYADKIIVTTDNSRNEDPLQIIKDICTGFEMTKHTVIRDRKEAIKTAIKEADDGDIVAILGKGSERYNIDDKGYHSFNERDIVITALNKRQGEI